MAQPKTEFFFSESTFRIILAMRGYKSIAEFSRAAKISEPHAGQIVRGLIPSAETRSRMAAFLEVAEHAIWCPVERREPELRFDSRTIKVAK